jgi:hypothetical protein
VHGPGTRNFNDFAICGARFPSPAQAALYSCKKFTYCQKLFLSGKRIASTIFYQVLLKNFAPAVHNGGERLQTKFG